MNEFFYPLDFTQNKQYNKLKFGTSKVYIF